MASSADRIRRAAEQYRQEGYATISDAIDDTLVDRARNHIDWLLETNPDKRPEQLGTELVAGDPFWVRLVSDERLLDVVEEFIGPDIALFASHYIAKPPGDGQQVLWHQDGVYWPLDPKQDVVTVWLAFDQTRPSNGCMEVIPGTQTLELQDIETNTEVENVLGSQVDMDIDTADSVSVELEPGDISVHHPNILHGSESNVSYNWRRGLTIRYIPASTEILLDETDDADAFESALMLRGDPETGVNDYQPWPRIADHDHMEFAGSEAYDARAEKMNDRVAGAGCLTADPSAHDQ